MMPCARGPGVSASCGRSGPDSHTSSPLCSGRWSSDTRTGVGPSILPLLEVRCCMFLLDGKQPVCSEADCIQYLHCSHHHDTPLRLAYLQHRHLHQDSLQRTRWHNRTPEGVYQVQLHPAAAREIWKPAKIEEPRNAGRQKTTRPSKARSRTRFTYRYRAATDCEHTTPIQPASRPTAPTYVSSCFTAGPSCFATPTSN